MQRLIFNNYHNRVPSVSLVVWGGLIIARADCLYNQGVGKKLFFYDSLVQPRVGNAPGYYDIDN